MSQTQHTFPGSDFFSGLLGECREITRKVEELDQPGVLIRGSQSKSRHRRSDDIIGKETPLDDEVSDLFNQLSQQLVKLEQRMGVICRQAREDRAHSWDDWMDHAAECYHWINKESMRIEDSLCNRPELNYQRLTKDQLCEPSDFGPLTKQEQFVLERQASAKKRETEQLKRALRAEMMHDLPMNQVADSHEARDLLPPTEFDDCKRDVSLHTRVDSSTVGSHRMRSKPESGLIFDDAMIIDGDAGDGSGHCSDVEMDICSTESSSPTDKTAPISRTAKKVSSSSLLSPKMPVTSQVSGNQDSVMQSTPVSRSAFTDCSSAWLPKTPNLEDFGLHPQIYGSRGRSQTKRSRLNGHRSSVGANSEIPPSFMSESSSNSTTKLKDDGSAASSVFIAPSDRNSPVMPTPLRKFQSSTRNEECIQTPEMPKSLGFYSRSSHESSAMKATLSSVNGGSEESKGSSSLEKVKLLKKVTEEEIARIPSWMRSDLGSVDEINEDISRINEEAKKQGSGQLSREQLSNVTESHKSLLMFLTETKRMVPRWIDGGMKYVFR